MRTQLLCALAILCGADVAQAQMSPAYATNGYYQGYGAGYQAVLGSNGYYGYPQNARPAGYAPYYQGYGNYPSQYYYPNYAARNPASYYQTNYPRYYPYPQNTPPVSAPPVEPVTTNVVQAQLPPVVEPDAEQYLSAPEATASEPAAPPASAPPARERVWTAADYMMTFIRSQRLPAPLVTTGSITDANPGALGQFGTGVLFGNNIDYGVFSGVRAEIGVYLDDADSFSVEASGQYSFQNSVNFAKAGDGTGIPVLTRPIFNVVTGTERAFLDSFPGISAGSVSVQAKSQFLGAELDTSYHYEAIEHLHLEGLFGFRFLRLEESLALQDQLRPLQDNVLTFGGPLNFVNAPNALADAESFGTTNNFYGVQLGGRIEWVDKWYTLGAFTKLAVGATNETADINGSTTLFTPVGNQVATGAILALPSNIGHYERNVFSFVPEAGVNVAVNVLPHLQLTAGYSFLYWNELVRPANQIDRGINTSQVPTDISFGQATGPARPVYRFNGEAFWMQALTFGVDLHY